MKVGDSVKIKENTIIPNDDFLCDDEQQVNYGGWQGRIHKIVDDEFVEVIFDSITIEKDMGFDAAFEQFGTFIWEICIFEFNDIIPCEPRDTMQDTLDKCKEFEERFKKKLLENYDFRYLSE